MTGRLAAGCVAAVLFATAQPAAADTCLETLVRVMMGSQERLPSKSIITTVTSGQKPVVNHHLSNGSGDWMTEVVEPPSMPWSLAVRNVLYTSTDKGKSWKKVRELNDAGHNPDVVRKEQEAIARLAQNVLCSVEEIGGIRYDKVEADLHQPQMNMATRQTYWLDAKSRRTIRSHSVIRMAGMETAVTQVIEYPQALALPKPE